MFPLTSTSQSNQPIPNSISSASLSDTFGRFLSPDYRREQIIELHAALYGGRDKEEIREVVLDCYDANASTSVISFLPLLCPQLRKDAIADIVV